MKKRLVVFIILSILLSLIVGCGRQDAKKGQETNNSDNLSSASAANTSAGDSNPSDSLAMKIVFSETINDPQAEYLNTIGKAENTGNVKLDLVLYQTEPDVYEGYGILTRTLDIINESAKSKQKFVYRTGLIHAVTGKECTLTITGGLTEDRDTETLMGDVAPFHLVIRKDGSMIQKNVPFILKLDGDKALLSIKLHEKADFVFNGILTDEPKDSVVGNHPKTDGIIYINSLCSASVTGEGDYTAILLAQPNADKSVYTGQISINGNGSILGNISENININVNKFDSALYSQWGGKLSDTFSYMGIIYTSGENYILLLDGEQAVLEPVGESIYFYGGIRSLSEYSVMKKEADKTKQMLTYLCRDKSNSADIYSEFQGLDSNNPEDMEKIMKLSEKLSGMIISEKMIPAWYPEEMIPTVNFYEDGGYSNIPPVPGLFFKIYTNEYSECEDFPDLVKPYRDALSGYDEYQEYIDYKSGEGIFLFSMGKYRLQIHLMQSNLKISAVTVQIY